MFHLCHMITVTLLCFQIALCLPISTTSLISPISPISPISDQPGLCNCFDTSPVITFDWFDYNKNLSSLCPGCSYTFGNIFAYDYLNVSYEYSGNVSFDIYQGYGYIGSCPLSNKCDKVFKINATDGLVVFIMSSVSSTDIVYGIDYHKLNCTGQENVPYQIPLINYQETQNYTYGYEYYYSFPFTNNFTIEFQSTYEITLGVYYGNVNERYNVKNMNKNFTLVYVDDQDVIDIYFLNEKENNNVNKLNIVRI